MTVAILKLKTIPALKIDDFTSDNAIHTQVAEIANLGVVSYSPSIYYAKLSYLIENGYNFKKVIIIIYFYR